MIEVSTSLANLNEWKTDAEPFYFELLGETSPLLDESFAEVMPASGGDSKPTSDAPVYEYWWTLGHPGAPETHSHWLERQSEKEYPWQNLADPAARIYVYFPIGAGWRASEITATMKYLSPVSEQHTWIKTAAQDLQAIQPIVGDAASVSGLVPGGSIVSKWLGAVAKLQVSSLPQSGDLNWSVGKVTFGSPHGVMQGVMWTIPRTVFQRVGGRLTGSLAVSFVPAHFQNVAVPEGNGSGIILAHAVVYGASGQQFWIPEGERPGRGFLELKVSPRVPGAESMNPSGQ